MPAVSSDGSTPSVTRASSYVAASSAAPCCGASSWVSSSSAPPSREFHRRLSLVSACSSGSTIGDPPATRSSTAAASGSSPCGERAAEWPLTRSVGASAPLRGPKENMAGRTASLSLTSEVADTVSLPPRAVV
eukprot:6214376-Pleurochrysis_carterae.AAC.1